MKTIMHISDLHFGRVDTEVCDGLTRDIEFIRPQLLAVSGDVTQRATVNQFQAFDQYIRSFPIAKVIVPGNHDVPLYNLFARFTRPLHRFRKFVEPNEFPTYEDDDLFVLGANTAHSWTVSGGRLSNQTTDTISKRFDKISPKKLRVLVCHHPMHEAGKVTLEWVGGIEKIRSRVDLILTGHLHQTASEVLPRSLGQASTNDSSVILLRAGTAISERHRGEPNSYNLIHTYPDHVEIEHRVWDATSKHFRQQSTQAFASQNGIYRADILKIVD